MKESEALKEAIEGNRAKIAKAEREILKLNRQLTNPKVGQVGWIDTRGHPVLIAELQSKIANWEQSNQNMESRLPRVEALEQVAANVETKAIQQQAEREAAAKAERDQAIRGAALDAWIVQGGDPARFDAEWPTMQATLAREAALDAAAVVAAQPSQGDQVRAAALQALTAKYGKPVAAGPAIQVGDPAAPSVRDDRLFYPVPKKG